MKQESQELQRHFAEYIAKKHGLSFDEALARVIDGTYQRAPKKVKKKATRPAVKPKKKPLTVAQRIAKRLGPEGRARGGSPTVQGGAPGLGKRR